MKSVKFVSNYSKYNAGEVASFEDKAAEALVAKNIAKPFIIVDPKKQATPQVNKQETGGERKDVPGNPPK